MPITVLHLLHRLTFGGTERVVVHLVTRSRSEVVNFICSFDEPDPDFLSELGPMKDRVFFVRKRAGNDPSLPFKIAAFCKRRRVDIVHSLGWGTYAEGLAATKLIGRNRRFLHSFRGKTVEDTSYIPRRRILAQRFFSRFCDMIITPSEMSRNEYANLIGIRPERIVVIYNGVQVQDFEGSVKEKCGRDHFGLRCEDIVIGCVARFDPVKHIDALIRAFAGIEPAAADRCRLLLVGDGPEITGLKRLAEDLGVGERVVFAGMRRDIPQCLSLMDIYVQPSRFEGMPNAVLEAMAARVPVVATNVGGVSEVVEHGVTGFLVSSGDDAELSCRMTDMLLDPAMRKEMGSAGRERVKAHFSMDKMISDYEGLYRRILKTNETAVIPGTR
jgi:glycosyltransferase involved in cell wall biosynthesis